MKTEKINIAGMSCEHCIKAVKAELLKLDLNINYVKIGSAEIEYEESKINHKQIENAIEEAGYKVE